jgi:hypothetical protein
MLMCIEEKGEYDRIRSTSKAGRGGSGKRRKREDWTLWLYFIS